MSTFQCQLCGRCCRWPGPVRLADDEPEAIAAHLGLEVREFIARHTALTADRTNLTLLEKEDGSCAFLSSDNRCLIETVKPRQCRDFPFRWRVDDEHDFCPAWRLIRHDSN